MTKHCYSFVIKYFIIIWFYCSIILLFYYFIILIHYYFTILIHYYFIILIHYYFTILGASKLLYLILVALVSAEDSSKGYSRVNDTNRSNLDLKEKCIVVMMVTGTMFEMGEVSCSCTENVHLLIIYIAMDMTIK